MNEEQKQIERCADLEEHLTDWEAEFIESIGRSIRWHGLIGKQSEILEQIVEKLEERGVW